MRKIKRYIVNLALTCLLLALAITITGCEVRTDMFSSSDYDVDLYGYSDEETLNAMITLIYRASDFAGKSIRIDGYFDEVQDTLDETVTNRFLLAFDEDHCTYEYLLLYDSANKGNFSIPGAKVEITGYLDVTTAINEEGNQYFEPFIRIETMQILENSTFVNNGELELVDEIEE
ncbi:MAG: hypothetical protein MJ245_02835 [Clostridia bacterium]|nr:hypothetical protein [Clostridia bacterium]